MAPPALPLALLAKPPNIGAGSCRGQALGPSGYSLSDGPSGCSCVFVVKCSIQFKDRSSVKVWCPMFLAPQ